MNNPDNGDAVDQVPEPAPKRVSNSWLEHLGAFYDMTAVRSLLGREGEPVTRQTVHEREGLLALTTRSGKVVYPVFQFRGRRLVRGLDLVLAELPESLVSRWTLASWLTSTEHDLGGQRPIDVLFDEGPGGMVAVVRVARTWAVQLAG